MKIVARFLTVFSLAVVCSFSLLLSAARADDGQEGGDDLNGSESIETEIPMIATPAAPAGSSAELSLEAENEDGVTEAKLKLETKGVPADTYFVSVTLKSDGTTVSLGSFSSNGDDAEIEFGSEGEDADDNMPLPANFNPLDIATVTISNSANVVFFTADLTTAASASSMIRNATVQATAAPLNPSATGTAVLAAHVVKGQTKGTLQVIAQGLPSNLSMVIATNGVMAKNVNTNKTGNLKVTLGAKGKTGTVAPGVNLFGVTSMTVRDKLGNLLLSASF